MAIQSLLAKIGVDTKSFNKGLSSAEKRVGGFKGAIAKLGAAIAGIGFVAMARNAINAGSRISDLSEQLRINAEALQTLNAIAIKAGVQQKTLERAIRNVSIRTQEAIDGNNTYLDAFKRLGIEINAFSKLPTEKKLEAIAQAYSRAGKSQEAFADIANVLGQKAGPEMLEILRRVNDEGLDNLIQGAKDTGQIMEQDVINTMDEAADMIGKVTNALTVATANIVSVFAPAIMKLTDFITKNSKQVVAWTRRLASFVIGVKAAVVILPVLSGALKVYAVATKGAAVATAAFAASLTGLRVAAGRLIGMTGIGLLFVGFTELSSHLIFSKAKSDDLTDSLDDQTDTTEDLSLSMDEMNAQLEKALSGTMDFEEGLDKLTESEQSAAEASRERAEALKEEKRAQEELLREAEEQFFLEKELQLLRLKAAGKNKEAEALEKSIRLTKEANDIMKKYNLTQQEAIELVQGLEEQRNKEMRLLRRWSKLKNRRSSNMKNPILLDMLSEKLLMWQVKIKVFVSTKWQMGLFSSLSMAEKAVDLLRSNFRRVWAIKSVKMILAVC